MRIEATRRRKVGEALLALVVLAVITLGLTWRYYTTETRIKELEAQEARRSKGSEARAASTTRKAAPGSTEHLTLQTSPARTLPVSPPSGVEPSHLLDADLPWRHPGLCVGGAGTSKDRQRTSYLRSFVATAAWHTTLHVHPEVPAWAPPVVRASLEELHGRATKELGLESSPPFIYLYPTLASLREHSCASAHAVAYYDGAIHLAPMETSSERQGRRVVQQSDGLWDYADSELLKSLRHEYAHHVLVSNGVGRPIWFQEGIAMTFANDAPSHSYDLWHEHPIDVADMVESFPTTATLEQASAFYANASVMMDFLGRLCLARVDCNAAELVDALISREASPETLFDWATTRRGGDLAHTAKVALWDDYVAHRNFAPATYRALLQRSRPTDGQR